MAAWSTTGPRPTFTMSTPGLHIAKKSADTKPRVSGVSGQVRMMTSDFGAKRSSKSTGPPCSSVLSFTSSSAPPSASSCQGDRLTAKTCAPSAVRLRQSALPMAPYPTTDTYFPRTWRGIGSPPSVLDWNRRGRSGKCLSKAMARKSASSAVASALPVSDEGMLLTAMPQRVAASMSTPSSPTPNCRMHLSSGADCNRLVSIRSMKGRTR
mmetsp:Transcript_53155/g.154710  ORF Transcript_53155/g.154710 Transcript_53155/m.154710 type:complete len:210 (-) Transcript_53155:325-954(-)